LKKVTFPSSSALKGARSRCSRRSSSVALELLRLKARPLRRDIGPTNSCKCYLPLPRSRYVRPVYICVGIAAGTAITPRIQRGIIHDTYAAMRLSTSDTNKFPMTILIGDFSRYWNALNFTIYAVVHKMPDDTMFNLFRNWRLKKMLKSMLTGKSLFFKK